MVSTSCLQPLEKEVKGLGYLPSDLPKSRLTTIREHDIKVKVKGKKNNLLIFNKDNIVIVGIG